MGKKVRLDVLLVQRALQESRQKAQATIMSGQVFVDGQRVDKPGAPVAGSSPRRRRPALWRTSIWQTTPRPAAWHCTAAVLTKPLQKCSD